jgi:leader peptidase (prepilin peptidase)/N-methyltransferase
MWVSPGFDAALVGVLGLLIGSFLNVVIYRLPKILERQWAAECAEISGTPLDDAVTFNLMVPRSRCQACNHQIRSFENIPVISYAFLRGKCSACSEPISIRYPLVELACGGLFFFCAWRSGLTPATAVWCAFSAALLVLALIDWDTTLLPDDITLPLVWGGVIAASLGWTSTPLSSSVWGAVVGYLSLWLIFWAFKLLTGKDGMGYGDFKLFAALGAWFGWPALVPMILMASVIGAVVGIGMKFTSGLREGGYIPFGPFLAGAGLTAMVFGPASLLRLVGL